MVDTRTAILQALMKGESYGLEVIDRVRAVTAGKVIIRQASVYPTLRTLEREGLLRSYDGESVPETGGRPRRYYELTAIGRRVATSEAKALIALVTPALGTA